ncbi:hypothetical protein FC19_GL002151 [Liquorilactobacillus aquaticus DSM 21051]|uniref:Accessory Sec system protein Asp3 n=1 Tax=Liquorilactobacillus aquaticus DSM 21051 TaxID=1423725 RepID=A0A0R2D593_9LACO|nr:accessory Sec system protein Asp3 [Liquorilactobacillus aquaticus]KRM95059.1 hypothetical protein FC19_GL002151 [Liquorilactobacillus aquaticus DSM 21051]
MIGYTANVIYWKSAVSTYLYGSDVAFHQNGEVDFENKLMSPGKTINTWYSQTNYQAERFSPQLPILRKGASYRLLLRAHSFPEASLYLRIDFYDRGGQVINRIFIKKMEELFEYPDNAYYYTINLLNAGCTRLKFKYMMISAAELPSIRNTEVFVSQLYNVQASGELNVIFEEPLLNACAIPGPKINASFKNCVFVESVVSDKRGYTAETTMKRIERISKDYKKIIFWGNGSLSNMIAKHYVKLFHGSKICLRKSLPRCEKSFATPLFNNSTVLSSLQEKTNKDRLENASKVSD